MRRRRVWLARITHSYQKSQSVFWNLAKEKVEGESPGSRIFLSISEKYNLVIKWKHLYNLYKFDKFYG
jgi:hypothetical protein